MIFGNDWGENSDCFVVGGGGGGCLYIDFFSFSFSLISTIGISLFVLINFVPLIEYLTYSTLNIGGKLIVSYGCSIGKTVFSLILTLLNDLCNTIVSFLFESNESNEFDLILFSQYLK